MKKRTHRRHMLELDDREINQQRVWARGEHVEESRWVSLDPDDVAGRQRSGWWEKSHVSVSSRSRRGLPEDDGRLRSRWRGLAVVMCALGVASMALLPVLLHAYLGGWVIPSALWVVCAGVVVVLAVVIMVASPQGWWRFLGGVFVAVLVCVAVVCAGLFSAQIFGLTS